MESQHNVCNAVFFFFFFCSDGVHDCSIYYCCHIYPILFFCLSALELSSELGGLDLEPFYSLIEGGREGPFFAELEEFFYYAQIRRYMHS